MLDKLLNPLPRPSTFLTHLCLALEKTNSPSLVFLSFLTTSSFLKPIKLLKTIKLQGNGDKIRIPLIWPLKLNHLMQTGDAAPDFVGDLTVKVKTYT